ncbi:MAG: 3-keto-5-aminohexanoate cleavage protein [Acidimicrobiia bacterium]|nr:3-keto-5-aminohexanoate cleavage protein [Acidimicrobiia bacterium]
MTDPVIIQAAITGSITDPTANPAVPVTVEENVRDALACWEAGASIIAIHAREDDGRPTQDVTVYRAIVDGVRAAGCDAVLNVSTGSANGNASGAERYACVELGTEMATFDAGSVNLGDEVFQNSVPFLRDLAVACRDHGVKPEIECFDTGHIATALRLRDDGLLADPLHFQFVLGFPGGGQPSTVQLIHMRSLIPAGATWSVCGIGRHQLPLNLVALVEGGHLRTGIEDNIYYHRGQLATNVDLVERLVRIASELGISVATPQQARDILSLH